MKLLHDVPEKHVFVCVNERTDGRDCCAHVGGMDVFMELKKFVIGNGLTAKVWVTRTGCLGFCNKIGTTVVVYPDQKWFLEVTMKDLENVKTFIREAQ